MSVSTILPNNTVVPDATSVTIKMTTTSTLPTATGSLGTIMIVSLCVIYFACAGFSAWEFIAYRELLSDAVKALQLCLGIQSFLRCIFMLLAYFVTPSSVIGSEFELAVLGDLPGLIYAFICGWLSCEFITNRFNLRTSRGESHDLILKVAMIIAALVFLIAWSITVVLVSTQASPGGTNYARQTFSTRSSNTVCRVVILEQMLKWSLPRLYEFARSASCMFWWRALLASRLAYSGQSTRPKLYMAFMFLMTFHSALMFLITWDSAFMFPTRKQKPDPSRISASRPFLIRSPHVEAISNRHRCRSTDCARIR